MKSKNKLIILGLLMAVFLSLPSIDAFAAAITWDGGAGTSNWNDADNWSGNAVPTSSDDVTINTAVTVLVNTAADVNSLTINNASAVLRPDASSGRTMRIRDFLTLTTGSILYTNAGGTGRLSWTFDGAGATNSINNGNAASQASKLQFANLTIDGAITTVAGNNNGDMEVYGTLTVNGSFVANNDADDSHVYFKGSSNSIVNNGQLELYDVTFNNNSTYNTATDITINGDLTVASGSSVTVQTPAIMTLDGDTKNLTATGTLTYNEGASLNVNIATTLVGDLADFDADMSVDAVTLTVTEGDQIQGDGSITTVSGSTIVVGDVDGVAGAIELDTYSWNAATNFTIVSGSTGFSGASVTAMNDLTFGTETGAALAITITEGFTVSGSLAIIENTGGVTTVTASAGTITMSGTGETINANDETLSFYGLNITGTISGDESLSTLGAGEGSEGFTIQNYFGIQTSGEFDIDNSTGDEAYNINFTSTNSIEIVPSGGLELLGAVGAVVTLNFIGTTTFLDDLTIAQAGDLADDFYLFDIEATATVDFDTYFVSLSAATQDLGDLTTASGSTLKVGIAGGLNAAIVDGDANAQIALNTGTNLEFHTNATTMGLADVDQAAGADTDFDNFNDLVINGAAIVSTDATNIPIQVDGDITVSAGSMILNNAAQIITMGTTQNSTITNGTSTASNLTFRGLEINGAFTVTTSGDFHLGAATDLLDFATGAGTLDATTNDSHIYISGAGAINNTITTGTANFHDLTITGAIAVTLDPDVTLMNIQGDLTLDNAGGSLTGGALSHVTFNGSSAQTIETTSGTLSLDLVTISNSTGVTTNDDMTFGNQDGATVISGKFSATSGTVTLGGTTNALTVSGNSATFFNLNAGTATSATGDLSVIKTLSGTAYTQTSDDITFLGDPADTDATAITNDGKQIANSTVTTLTITGTLVVDSNCEFQTALAIAGAGTVDANGRLELTATAATFTGGTIDISGGGTLHLSGTNTTDLGDVSGTLTAGSTANAILSGDQTTVVGGAITLNNLTLSSTTATVLEGADDITLHGNLIQDGNNFGDSDDDSKITFAGTSTQTVSGTGDISVGEIVVNAGADVEVTADIILEDADAAVITIASTGSYVASAGSTTFDAQTSGTNIVNSNADGSGLEFHDVTIAAAATDVGFNTPFTINGSLTNVAGGNLIDDGSGKVTFSGSGETITVAANNEFEFNDVTFTGSYGLSGDFIIDIGGDLEVTNTGSFDMNSVGVINFDGAATSQIINDGNLTINSLTFSNASTTVTTSDNFTVEGNFSNSGNGEAFVASGSSLITFAGSSTLTGDDGVATNTQFMNITVDGTVTLVEDIQISGNLIVNGTLARTNDDDLVTFAGATTKSIQNNGTLTLGSLTINNVANNIVTTATDFSTSGTMTIGGATGGAFNATAGIVTFNAGGAQSLDNATGAATSAKFYGLTVSAASTTLSTTANSDFNIYGDLTLNNDAQLDCQANNTRIYFTGSSEQDITLNATDADLLLHNVTVNNTGGIKLVGSNGDIALNQIDVEGTLFLQSGDLDLNGNNILTIDVTNGGKLSEPASGGRVLNNGPFTSTGHIYAQLPDQNTTLSSNNIGGLGAYITTTADPDAVTVKRYHIPLTVGGDQQISRYYSITNDVASIGGKVGFTYDTDELGTIDEADLILVYGDDPATDIWTIEESTLNTTTKRLTTEPSVVSQFTGQTEWWTAGSPDVLSATAITNGLATSPISAGTDDNAIFGVQFTSNGSIDLSEVRFNLGRALGATNEVSNWKLVYSGDDDYSTTEDNVELIDVAPGGTGTTGGQSGDSYITFDVSGENASYITVNEGTPINYFLVIDVVSTVTAATSTITPSTGNTIVTLSGGITEEFSLTGSAYSFRASIMVSPHEVGISDSPLVANQEDVVLFGFKATLTSASGLPGITGFDLGFDQDPSDIFENVRVYASATENDYNDMTNANLISTTTANVDEDGFTFAFTSKKQLATTPTYFFVVADVKAGVNNTTPDITPTLTYADLTSTDAGIRGTDIDGNAADSHSGYIYSFANNTVSVSVDNNPASSNLGTRVDRQPIFGFTLTPDNNQEVTFTGADITVTLSSAGESANLSNWALYYDSNENGYPETSEKIANGTLTSTSGSGNLTFSVFTQTLSAARKYLVGVKVGSGATAGTTIKTQLTSTDYLTVSSPARLNTAGPLPSTANTHTIRTAGTATALEIVHNPSSVVTGNTLGVTVRAVDANGYPTNVSAAETVTIAKVSGTGTVGGTTTGTIANGTSRVIVSPTITAASGSTDLVIRATGSSLTASGNTSAITVLETEPTANDAVVTIANVTATTARITNITANSGSTDGRIVVIRQGSAPHVPTDGVAYTANLDIADAGAVGVGQTGPGSYVVMANVAAGAAVYSNDIEGLMPNTRYYVQVFDYNGTTPNFNYATGTAFTSESSRNPISFTTSSGDVSSGSTETAPANIQTDIDITSTISAADEEDWYQFRIPSTRNNVIIRLSNLPANYQVELYDASAGIVNKTLLRDSKVTSTGDEVIILNGADAGPYVLKIYGADGDAYSSSNYTLRVTTSTTEIFSQVE